MVGSAVYCNFLRHPSCSANNTRPRGSSVCSPSAFAGTSETRVTLEVGHIRPRFFTMMTLRAVPCVVHANSVSRVESRVPISSVASCHRVISGTNKSAIVPHRRASVRLRVSQTDTDETPSTSFDPPWSAPGYRNAVVSAMPQPAQAASVLAVWGGLAAVTTFACGAVGPFLANHFPEYMAWSRGLWPVLGVTYIAAGAAHFGLPKGFEDMFPHNGAWGFWYLPGGANFHVKWTGVAELVGGIGMASALVTGDTPVSSASALGLFVLTAAVTPANTYMWSHNAPGPLPENPDEAMLSLQKEAHLARAALQVLLLSVTWGMAHPV